MYAYLSALVTLIVMVASLIQVVIHFTLKVCASCDLQIMPDIFKERNHQYVYQL